MLNGVFKTSRSGNRRDVPDRERDVDADSDDVESAEAEEGPQDALDDLASFLRPGPRRSVAIRPRRVPCGGCSKRA